MYVLAGTVSQFVLPVRSILKHQPNHPGLLLYTPRWLPFPSVLKSKHLVRPHEAPTSGAADLSSPSFTIPVFLPARLTLSL